MFQARPTGQPRESTPDLNDVFWREWERLLTGVMQGAIALDPAKLRRDGEVRYSCFEPLRSFLKGNEAQCNHASNGRMTVLDMLDFTIMNLKHAKLVFGPDESEWHMACKEMLLYEELKKTLQADFTLKHYDDLENLSDVDRLTCMKFELKLYQHGYELCVQQDVGQITQLKILMGQYDQKIQSLKNGIEKYEAVVQQQETKKKSHLERMNSVRVSVHKAPPNKALCADDGSAFGLKEIKSVSPSVLRLLSIFGSNKKRLDTTLEAELTSDLGL